MDLLYTTQKLERWYDYRTIDWTSELEYPEFTMKQSLLCYRLSGGSIFDFTPPGVETL